MIRTGLTFVYRAQRKLRREYRKRFQQQVVARDLRELSAVGNLPATSLERFTRYARQGWSGAVDEWFDEQEAKALIEFAERAVAQEFQLLGSGWTHAGHPIDWHQDLKTGYRWPVDKHHLDIDWAATPPGSDIKMPWELSRCQHFVSLALAWQLTGGLRYWEAYRDQLKSWIKANPCGYGVNWVCAMDVAIRAVNWLVAWSLFHHGGHHPEDTKDLGKDLIQSLWLHGCHIKRNLEWQGPWLDNTANHFLADIAGLFGIGLLFQDTARGRDWATFSRKWLEREIRRQVHPDGSNFETSTSYHRLSFEMFLWCSSMAAASGRPFSEEYREILGKMSKFVDAYCAPSGQAAQFGDNDSGRFLSSGIGEPGDHRYLGSAPAGLGARANRLLLGSIPASSSRIQRSEVLFPDGGYAFAERGPFWIGVRAGKFGKRGAHAHCDQLHIVLSVDEYDFIVDPGTGMYSADPQIRNLFRSSLAHNGPVLNGWETNCYPRGQKNIFCMADDTNARIEEKRTVGQERFFYAVHTGYERLRTGSRIARAITLRPNGLILEDHISTLSQGDVLTWLFTLHPGITARVSGHKILLSNGIRSIVMAVSGHPEVEIVRTQYSAAYGVRERTNAVRISCVLLSGGDFCQIIKFGKTCQ